MNRRTAILLLAIALAVVAAVAVASNIWQHTVKGKVLETVKVDTDLPEVLELARGETKTYYIKITNTGKISEDLILYIEPEADSGVKVHMRVAVKTKTAEARVEGPIMPGLRGHELVRFTLSPGETAEGTITFTVDRNSAPGEFKVKFELKRA